MTQCTRWWDNVDNMTALYLKPLSRSPHHIQVVARWLQSNMVRRVLVAFLPLPMVLMGIASGGTSQKDGTNSLRSFFWGRWLLFHLFRHDRWCDGAPLRENFPCSFVLALDRDASIADYWKWEPSTNVRTCLCSGWFCWWWHSCQLL